ncbi:MAG TPA: purine-binding chemotaxis protein CheW [Clostridiales bacterium]|nr:purine-binding chemotaxis protein CheW [Clostridiales bacterium]
MESTKQAIFKLGDDVYGMDIMNIKSIENPIPVEKVKKAPDNIIGMIDLRGDRLPVYSLRRKFGLEDKETDADTRLLITNSNNIPIAYEVDKMEEITVLMEDQVLDQPSIFKSNNTSYMKAITKKDDRLIILMDEDGILAEDEKEKIGALLKKS